LQIAGRFALPIIYQRESHAVRNIPCSSHARRKFSFRHFGKEAKTGYRAERPAFLLSRIVRNRTGATGARYGPPEPRVINVLDDSKSESCTPDARGKKRMNCGPVELVLAARVCGGHLVSRRGGRSPGSRHLGQPARDLSSGDRIAAYAHAVALTACSSISTARPMVIAPITWLRADWD
jgi:hypothetical protein